MSDEVTTIETQEVESTEPKVRGRKSETTEFTQGMYNKLIDLQNAGAFDEVILHGNTIIVKFDKDNGFKFRPNPLGGIVLGAKEAKYSVEACINSVTEFIRAKGNTSSTKYNAWVKELVEKDSNNKKLYPNTANVMIACGVWPARSILHHMINGILPEATIEDIINKQKELDAE